MRVLITGGPTREPIDPVRYISNYSTGAMGLALARAALARGHEALLVLGPVAEQPPVGAEVYAVESTRDMLAAVLDFLPDVDALVFSAAVCDYRPKEESARKLKRGEVDSIELIENPDIAAEAGARRGDRPSAVFALETNDGVANAVKKLEKKNADVCVLNAPAAIGADEAEFTLVLRDGTVRELGERSKDELAVLLLEALGL
ncbi:MAG: phosphopantothenoylcysteine decarboxylase domain-containing protein [Planctomycetota bacterium]|jgi:phosphopantothenoylcysteine decarboxylase/phosphopantothenate--cysteine ligase